LLPTLLTLYVDLRVRFTAYISLFCSARHLQSGGARGHNIGILYRFFDDNPSALGVSVLNAGKAKFGEGSLIHSRELKDVEEKAREEAQNYDVELKKPDTIPQIVNAGLTLGIGDSENIFRATATAEYDDIGGDTLDNKFGASWEIGLELPDKLAMMTVWPIYEKDKNVIHMGLLGISAFGGYRAKAYSTKGAKIAFHFGYNRIVSLVKLEVEGFEETPLKKDSEYVAKYGVRGILGLTLIF